MNASYCILYCNLYISTSQKWNISIVVDIIDIGYYDTVDSLDNCNIGNGVCPFIVSIPTTTPNPRERKRENGTLKFCHPTDRVFFIVRVTESFFVIISIHIVSFIKGIASVECIAAGKTTTMFTVRDWCGTK